MTDPLWPLLRDATRRGLVVSFLPGCTGLIRVEIRRGDKLLCGLEALGTHEPPYDKLDELLRRAVSNGGTLTSG